MRLDRICVATLILLLSACAQESAAETLEERRARVEQMDAEQKEQLLQNYQRFIRLDEAERERLRKLHGEIDAAPDQTELRSVLQRYNDWLNDLTSDQRAEITSTPPEERLKKVESLIASQKKQESFRLAPTDVEAMRTWIQAHKLDVKLRLMRDGGEKPVITPEQLDELREALSEDGRAKLDAARAEDDKPKANSRWSHKSVPRLLLTWAAQTSPNRRGFMGRPGGGVGNPGGGQHFRRPSESELQTFLKNDVSEQERADLFKLPHDEMQDTLRRLWFTREFRRGHDDRPRPGGYGPGGSGAAGAGPGGTADDRRSRGTGDKQRSERRRPSDAPPEKTPAEKPATESPVNESPAPEKPADEAKR
ncbi:MAG TPA: hypothetical protein VGJ26_09575 [Pirellulales bacterium]|jgi:hypothetical protein